jgi:hypothetical protein
MVKVNFLVLPDLFLFSVFSGNGGLLALVENLISLRE